MGKSTLRHPMRHLDTRKNPVKRRQLEEWKARVEGETLTKTKTTVEKARAADGNVPLAVLPRVEQRRSPLPSFVIQPMQYIATQHCLFGVVLFLNHTHQDLANWNIY